MYRPLQFEPMIMCSYTCQNKIEEIDHLLTLLMAVSLNLLPLDERCKMKLPFHNELHVQMNSVLQHLHKTVLPQVSLNINHPPQHRSFEFHYLQFQTVCIQRYGSYRPTTCNHMGLDPLDRKSVV